MLISIPSAAGLFALAEPICELLFASQDNSMLINVLRHGSLTVILYSLSTITNGLLQGLGHLSEPLKNSLIALVIHIAALIGILYISKGIEAVIYANTIFALTVCVLNIKDLHRHVRFKINRRNTFLVPSLSSLVMGGTVYGLSKFLFSVLPAGFSEGRAGLAAVLIICILVALLVYAAMLVILRAFTREELLEMPMGSRLYRFFSALGIM